MIKKFSVLFLVFVLLIACDSGNEVQENQNLMKSELSSTLLKQDIVIIPTLNNIDPLKNENVQLSSEAFITQDDIVSYRWSDHYIKLTETALEKFKSAEFDLHTKNFVFLVKGEKIYSGTFINGAYSGRWPGAVITHAIDFNLSVALPGIKIENGYHWTENLTDFRSNKKLKDILQELNLLK